MGNKLARMHGVDDKPVFPSVIVITDRRVAATIDTDSARRAAAANRGTPIIISTIQKFSLVPDRMKAGGARRRAMIVDAAHHARANPAPCAGSAAA